MFVMVTSNGKNFVSACSKLFPLLCSLLVIRNGSFGFQPLDCSVCLYTKVKTRLPVKPSLLGLHIKRVFCHSQDALQEPFNFFFYIFFRNDLNRDRHWTVQFQSWSVCGGVWWHQIHLCQYNAHINASVFQNLHISQLKMQLLRHKVVGFAHPKNGGVAGSEPCYVPALLSTWQCRSSPHVNNQCP